eukprot:scaffold1191_cov78-Cyclotella_meneghiniana.AAC.1
MPTIRHRKRKRSNDGRSNKSEKEACPYEGCYFTSYSISRHMAQCPHRPQPKRSARLQQQSERNQEPEDTQANVDTFHTYVELDPSNQDAMFPDTTGGDDGLIIQNAQTAFQNWQNTAEPHPYRAYTSFLYPTNAPQPQINNENTNEGEPNMPDQQNNVHVGDQTDNHNVGLVGNFGVNLAQRHYNLRKGNWDDITKFQTNLMYSPELAFQAHLLAELADFRHVPMELYDRIMEIFFVHVINGNLNFNRNYFYAQRRTIIKTLTEAHGMTQFKSKIVPVRMHHGGSVGCMVVAGGDNGTHGGGASPRLMWELDNLLEDAISNCDVFVDAGSGIGTSSAYHAQQYPNLRVVGIELAADRTQTARELYEIGGMGGRVEFVNGSFVDEDIWNEHVLRSENDRVCVWMNAENFVKVDRLMLNFEQLAERLMVQPGSMMISTEKLFQGKTRRSLQDGCLFVETRVAITLQEWDLSWKPPGGCLDIFVYTRVGGG